MKVNEIQIGDYVNYRGQIIKVTSLYDKGGSNEVGWSDKESVWVNADNVEPINLTPEILEKIGWIRTKYAYGRDCMEIHGADKLPEGVDNALSMARWSIDKNYQYHFLDLYMWKGSVMQHNVHYVHQLQHAFRNFGIEIEIKL
jgi:hypothetical protein